MSPRLVRALTAAAVTLGACQADPPPAPTHETIDVALHLERFVEMGVLSGLLTTRDGCLFIASDGVTFGVGWPQEATTWDPSTGTITVRQGGARVGDRVVVGGGPEQISAAEIGRYRWATPPRPDCLGDQFFFAASLESDPD
jgi:hypothetical protein